jgi:hypothetical protein
MIIMTVYRSQTALNSLTNFYTTQSQFIIDLSVRSAKTGTSTCLRILHTVGEPSVPTPTYPPNWRFLEQLLCG